MARIEDLDLQEFYAPFVRIEGERGTALLFYDDASEAADPESMALAAEIGEVLDGKLRAEVERLAASIERDRREPDKVLCHLQMLRRAVMS